MRLVQEVCKNRYTYCYVFHWMMTAKWTTLGLLVMPPCINTSSRYRTMPKLSVPLQKSNTLYSSSNTCIEVSYRPSDF